MERRNELKAELSVPFETDDQATIVYNSLRVDKEPGKGAVTRNMQVKQSSLVVEWKAFEARNLRVSVGSFLEHLQLVIETLQMFSPKQ